jgi:hypothetical protein
VTYYQASLLLLLRGCSTSSSIEVRTLSLSSTYLPATCLHCLATDLSSLGHGPCVRYNKFHPPCVVLLAPAAVVSLKPVTAQGRPRPRRSSIRRSAEIVQQLLLVRALGGLLPLGLLAINCQHSSCAITHHKRASTAHTRFASCSPLPHTAHHHGLPTRSHKLSTSSSSSSPPRRLLEPTSLKNAS